MKVILKQKEHILKQAELPFSIGDIVTLNTYGIRFVDQDIINKECSFYDGTKLNKWDTQRFYYETLDKKYGDLQWKIEDIGIYGNCYSYDFYCVKLINRDKKELLIQYRCDAFDLKIVRKCKKQCEEYIIQMKK